MCGSSMWIGACRVASRLMSLSIAPPSGRRMREQVVFRSSRKGVYDLFDEARKRHCGRATAARHARE